MSNSKKISQLSSQNLESIRYSPISTPRCCFNNKIPYNIQNDQHFPQDNHNLHKFRSMQILPTKNSQQTTLKHSRKYSFLKRADKIRQNIMKKIKDDNNKDLRISLKRNSQNLITQYTNNKYKKFVQLQNKPQTRVVQNISKEELKDYIQEGYISIDKVKGLPYFRNIQSNQLTKPASSIKTCQVSFSYRNNPIQISSNPLSENKSGYSTPKIHINKVKQVQSIDVQSQNSPKLQNYNKMPYASIAKSIGLTPTQHAFVQQPSKLDIQIGKFEKQQKSNQFQIINKKYKNQKSPKNKIPLQTHKPIIKQKYVQFQPTKKQANNLTENKKQLFCIDQHNNHKIKRCLSNLHRNSPNSYNNINKCHVNINSPITRIKSLNTMNTVKSYADSDDDSARIFNNNVSKPNIDQSVIIMDFFKSNNNFNQQLSPRNIEMPVRKKQIRAYSNLISK